MRAAPAIRAAWTQNWPIPPAPITTTLDPSSTRARFSTAPTPVSAAQPIRAPCSSGTSSGSGSTAAAGTTICSASAPIAVIRYTGAPSSDMRVVPSGSVPAAIPARSGAQATGRP